jgi:septal ring factor EnvC (AmiA/AmiB activator)
MSKPNHFIQSVFMKGLLNALMMNVRLGLLTFGLLFASLPSFAQDEDSQTSQPQEKEESEEDRLKREQLERLKKQIVESEKSIEKQQVKHQFLTNILKKSEKEISDVARQLNTIKSAKKSNHQEVNDLETEQAKLTREKDQNKKLLAGQLSSMYVNGSHDYSKLLLNQQEPGKLERVLGYYEYLNRARTKNLDRIETIFVRLNAIDIQLSEAISELNELEQQQLKKQSQLTKHQKDRRRTISQIQKRLKTESQQLEHLKINEQSLTAALARIKSLVTESIELAGLSHLKGHLGWPVNGNLTKKFGRKRRGSLRWKGVVIHSTTGTPVKTVQQGLVLFADWLKGFGWVIVVDHGDGYMSLYGHNQTLLKAVGEKVEAGEPIALVGKSGGQSKAGLYFEIRHQGIAINPAVWCKAGV